MVKKAMIERGISLTLQEIRPSDDVRLRFTEEAKRALAESVQVFIQHHLHVVALLTAHRGTCAPAEKDFSLASTLTDTAKLQRSAHEAELAAVQLEKPRKRLRRMAVVDFEFEAGSAEVADQQP